MQMVPILLFFLGLGHTHRELNRAATCIQAHVRGMLARHLYLRLCSERFQVSEVRARHLSLKLEWQLDDMITACNAALLRHEHGAAAKIQTFWRRWFPQRQWVLYDRAARRIQGAWRHAQRLHQQTRQHTQAIPCRNTATPLNSPSVPASLQIADQPIVLAIPTAGGYQRDEQSFASFCLASRDEDKKVVVTSTLVHKTVTSPDGKDQPRHRSRSLEALNVSTRKAKRRRKPTGPAGIAFNLDRQQAEFQGSKSGGANLWWKPDW
ncbi:unnamed protein product [Vitrella brassicaformis CCMP3155]|uniref:Uncharacterized protein n=1 Tax=Vitrella brassicaformis (strain CCMP3155) TaxID=1169540 RepID=A0A0G4H0G9_VITBC|nr:unnamed protein product [Vitrella brassicaformis CCMP3155]|eukprot:CEM36823.1 unnamed protein product [Vitrella brassicaformis CCMP3155]